MSGPSAAALANGLQVSLGTCPTPEVLEPQWRALEAQADPHFFTSWTWISCWLAHLGAERQPQLWRVHHGEDLVGLGLVVPQAARRLRWWPSHALHLHATGLRAWDDITVEHNGCLARRGWAQQVQAALVSRLWALAPEVDQLCLPGLSPEPTAWRLAAHPVVRLREHAEPAYRVDLEPLRSAGQPYLATLGPQTRSAVRRSTRLYEGLGPLCLSLAATVEEGLDFLSRLTHFHSLAWQARGRPGAFANPLFERFHRQLVSAGLPTGQIQLLRLTAGAQEVGYLYNFVHGGRALSYQSGFHFGLSQRNHHPGLVTHALAVQRALDTGLQVYDFLAGDSRHKQQLAHQRYQMPSVTLHRACLGLWVEEAWRQLRGRVADRVCAPT